MISSSFFAVSLILGAASRAPAQQCGNGMPPPCNDVVRPTPPTSLAVLTFSSRSRDTSEVFLAEGLADDISARLGQMDRLVVRSREAVRRLPNGATLSVPELGRRLAATYLLSGTMRQEGGRVHAVLELTQAQTSKVMWTSTFDQASDDLPPLQAEIVEAVMRRVAGDIRPSELRTVHLAAASSGPAFQHLTRGTAFLSRRVLRLAIGELQQAVAIDSSSGLAWARLAQALAICHSWGWPFCRADSTALGARARAAADRALRLNTAIADTWLADGLALTNADTVDEPAALASYQHAVLLDPQSAETYHALAFTQARLGDDAGAERSYRKALALDPGRQITWEHLARIAFDQGRYRDELALVDTALALEPGEQKALDRRFEAVTALGDTALLRAELARTNPSDSVDVALLEGFRHLATRDTAGAVRYIDRVWGWHRRGPDICRLLVMVGRLREADAAIATWQPPTADEWYRFRSPAFQSLRKVPRFVAYVDRARELALATVTRRR